MCSHVFSFDHVFQTETVVRPKMMPSKFKNCLQSRNAVSRLCARPTRCSCNAYSVKDYVDSFDVSNKYQANCQKI